MEVGQAALLEIETHCFHCDEPVDIHNSYSAIINGEEQTMCCPGCQAVAEAICDLGLSDYYRFRTEKPARPELLPDFLQQTGLYDNESIQNSFVDFHSDDTREANLIIEGLVCPACAWLVENRLSRLPGLLEIKVNFEARRCRLHWDDERISLSELLAAIVRLGYHAQPFNQASHEDILARENRQLLKQLGVAGLFGMQIMMIAVALYQAEWTGMESRFQFFFQYLSLVLCMPVLTYSAQPFFKGAWRDLKILRPGMDVPVALGLSLAFAGSVWATITQQGHTYYESVAMFVFFLLLGRYFEFSVRKKISQQVDVFSRIVPVIANRLNENGELEMVPVMELSVGETVRVKPGDSVPVDCILTCGPALVDESVITGESRPLNKESGDRLLAGSINTESIIDCRVEKISEDSCISHIQQLLNQALEQKSTLQSQTNRLASWFILFVLCVSTLVAGYWINQGDAQWLAITVSVLVITCPCALALATPLAVTAMIGSLMRNGILTRNNAILERFPELTDVVFDKTGTLTHGRLAIDKIISTSFMDEQQAIRYAAAIEQSSSHPLAQAFMDKAVGQDLPPAKNLQHKTGAGLSATLDNTQYYLGSANYIETILKNKICSPIANQDCSLIVLSDREQVLAYFYLSDQIRPEASKVIQLTKERGLSTTILSGDCEAAVAAVSEQLRVDHFQSELKPDDKLSIIRDLQSRGKTVLMLGDGINDGPVLAGADVSIAMGHSSDLIKNTADIIFLNHSLGNFFRLVMMSEKTRRVIRQNITWAISYNCLALPAAITGLVAPWLAALGMSLSSLLVVLNSARLLKS